MALLIRRARLAEASLKVPAGLTSIRVAGGVIVALGPGLRARPEERVIDAQGAFVTVGLHDHHLHLRALAAARSSVPAGPPQVRTARELAAELARAAAGKRPGGWVRAVGYHESVAGMLDRWSLDRLCPSPAVRVQHRSGSVWFLNSAALAALEAGGDGAPGVERDERGRPTGRIWRADRWLAARVPPEPLDLAAVSAEAAVRGVTGFTDATPGLGSSEVNALVDLARRQGVCQRLTVMADVGARLAPSGDPHPPVELGPVKVILDDDRLLGLADFVDVVRAAHDEGRPVAIHCVTRVQAVLAIAALEEAAAVSHRTSHRSGTPHGGSGDRVEHGAVLGPEMVVRLRNLGVTVVTQPAMLTTRGDQYLEDVEPVDLPDLWRLGSLVEAGLRVAGSTDAPFGPADPWVAVRAAMSRTTPSGCRLGPTEGLTARQAAALFDGQSRWPDRPRRVGPGQPADLCLLERHPESVAAGADPGVVATVIAGQLVCPPPGTGGSVWDS